MNCQDFSSIYASAKGKVKGSVACSDHRHNPDNGILIPQSLPLISRQKMSEEDSRLMDGRFPIDGCCVLGDKQDSASALQLLGAPGSPGWNSRPA